MTSTSITTAPGAGEALRPHHAESVRARAVRVEFVRAATAHERSATAPGRIRPLSRTKTPYPLQRVAAGFRRIGAARAQDKAAPMPAKAATRNRLESIVCDTNGVGTRLALFSPRLGRMDDYPEMLAIVRALARYLRVNPNSSDTAEGIAMWWFREQTVVDGRALLDALDWMRERGLVEMLSASSTGDRYRCTASADELDGVLQELSRRRLT
ncbi:hypothetical protein [Lysobacter sp. Root916]|uniref:hypothetical protein n=1 Tax=Lysobacter sp. Root916 TaxID=1736606 RepID=UPI0012F8686F|nr:hypothetical protein [Lysobacter sp. Root916]